MTKETSSNPLPTVTQPTERTERGVILAALRNRIADDALAASFQTLGQYRTYLLKFIEGLK